MGATRIVCIGSRLLPEDGAGPAVYDLLVERVLPPEVDLVDGGLAGLDLLRLVDGADRVVFVDGVSGFAPGPGVVLVSGAEAAASAARRFDHGAGLPYLLRMLPHACERGVPEILLVGVEGPATASILEGAARLALAVADGPDEGGFASGDAHAG